MSELKDAALGAHFIEEFKRALLLEGGYVTSLTAEVTHTTRFKRMRRRRIGTQRA
jgi:hypothetical protein